MSRLEDLADRIERLVLRHEELKRTNALLQQQLDGVTGERDSLRSRLAAARARIDALLDRLPAEPAAAVPVAPAPRNTALDEALPAQDRE
ncbi:cell division protein ZapB [Ideonella sp. DXS22W]|uniref:Cell division protein ZapB n=1 Tax=Pseudaquabacterium inlustre TaxID=2984192 RepID=A0ABU9CL72_9BURK